MCILIDTCCLPSVFDAANKAHEQFKPVHEWIFQRGGRIVIGGTKYRDEVGRMHRYAELLKQLATARKVVPFDDSAVDRAAKMAQSKCKDIAFNDPHLIGIVSVSGCEVICTGDKSALPYLKEKRLYPKSVSRPKIYSGARNKKLLDQVDCKANC
jgi:hypothetical protein